MSVTRPHALLHDEDGEYQLPLEGVFGMKVRGLFVCAVLVTLGGCGTTQSALAPTALAPQTVGAPAPMVRVHPGARYGVSGWTPADLQSAYKLPSATKGNGQIVAVVDAYDNPNTGSDLAEYRSEYQLGKAHFTKYNQDGQKKHFPQGSPAWGIEEDLDVEMVSASCPKCTIYLVEADSNSWADFEKAVQEAVKLGAHIVSNSWCGTGGDESSFETKGVEYLAAGGDAGGSGCEPADFESVASVGGTQLQKGGGGKRGWTESVWNDASGGCITGETKPPWQHLPGCDYRLVNDVGAVAADIAMYDSYSEGGWITVDGTAAPTPLLAGVFGLAGNANKQDGGRTFWKTRNHQYLFPVTTGDSGCAYVHGKYNTCAGWGSPNGSGAF